MKTDNISEVDHTGRTGMVKSLPVLVVIVGSILSFTGFFIIANREQSNIRAEFQKESENHTAALKKSIDDKLQKLDSIVHFYKSSVSVERDEFSDFVEAFLASEAISALGWAPRVIDSQRESFQKKAYEEGLEDFMIFELNEEGKPVPSAQRKEYFPIYYLQPEKEITQEYGTLLGYDLMAIDNRVDSLNYSRDTGKPSISKKIPLPTNNEKFGFLVLLPVYKTAAPTGTIEERRQNLEGFVVGLIRIKELIEESLALISTRGVEIRLFDLHADSKKTFIYGYVPGQSAQTDTSPKASADLQNNKFQREETFSVADRKWLIKSSPTPALISLFTTAQPWGFLIGGHILAVIGAGYIIITAKRTAAIEGLVKLRTSELNTELNEHKLTEEALRTSELQFRTLVENIPGAVFRCEIHAPWKMAHISNAALDITGYPADDFLEGKINFGDITIPSDYKMVEQEITESIKNKTPHEIEYGIYHADGSIKYVYERGVAIYDTNGQPLYLDGVIVDITDRRKNEEERERLLRAIETKNKELQSIVYVASHDLRSPLVNIMGFSDELKICCEELKDLLSSDILTGDDKKEIKKLLEDSIPQSLGFINSGTNQINMLINGLLQVSRAGSVSIAIETIDMNSLVSNVVENVIFRVRELGASITIGDLPPCQADGSMANQVFSNLIGNALKYLDPERKGQINVTGIIKGNNCVYCVEDNGLGIPEQSVEKVFEIFHRLNPSDTKGGEGLGLTIVTRILDRLNGSISLESKVGKGSKFYITLPKA
ncbi:MAG: PAS domain-containing protein [Planctomycetes bacterium]|nr:PAS domain-containing protein [Planctomycetota bacterium]